MRFTISETYEIVTPESAEYGDAEETGFEFREVEFTFSELVEYLISEGYQELSSTFLENTRTWATTPVIQDHDYFTLGHEQTKSLHCHNPNDDPRINRYWIKALRMAGLR